MSNPSLEVLQRERDQQERFKWEANKRADRAEQTIEILSRAGERAGLEVNGIPWREFVEKVKLVAASEPKAHSE